MQPTLGVVFRPQQPPEILQDVVRACDEAGVDELWLWEDCFLEGGLTTAAAALAWSDRLTVGVGLLPVPLRNPAVVAMEAATLARLWPQRFVLTLGHGVQEWMEQVGGRVSSPVTLLREHTTAVRRLLAGETVSTQGRYVSLDDVALDWPPPSPPQLLVGARGPRTVFLAGELADGVLLDAVADEDVVRRTRASVDEARASSGRPGRAHVTVYTEVDPAAATDTSRLASTVRQRVDGLAEAGADTVVLQATEADPDPRPLLDALDALRGSAGPG